MRLVSHGGVPSCVEHYNFKHTVYTLLKMKIQMAEINCTKVLLKASIMHHWLFIDIRTLKSEESKLWEGYCSIRILKFQSTVRTHCNCVFQGLKTRYFTFPCWSGLYLINSFSIQIRSKPIWQLCFSEPENAISNISASFRMHLNLSYLSFCMYTLICFEYCWFPWNWMNYAMA